jgi:hypothetical protein
MELRQLRYFGALAAHWFCCVGEKRKRDNGECPAAVLLAIRCSAVVALPMRSLRCVFVGISGSSSAIEMWRRIAGEMGILVAPSTILRWVIPYSEEFARPRPFERAVEGSWHA